MPALSIAEIPLALNSYLAKVCEGTPILWQDVPAEMPSGGIWVRPTLKVGEMAGTGEKGRFGLSRRVGVYLIDVYAPPPLMAQDAWEYAAELESAFRRECVKGVSTEDPTSANMGVTNNNACHVRVTVPFWCWAGK